MPSEQEIEAAAAAIRDFAFRYRNDVVSPMIHAKQFATAALTAAEAVRTRQPDIVKEAADEIERLRKVIAAEPTSLNSAGQLVLISTLAQQIDFTKP